MSAYYLFFSLHKIFFYLSVIQVIQIVKNLHNSPRKKQIERNLHNPPKKQNTHALYIKKYIHVRERDREMVL